MRIGEKLLLAWTDHSSNQLLLVFAGLEVTTIK